MPGPQPGGFETGGVPQPAIPPAPQPRAEPAEVPTPPQPPAFFRWLTYLLLIPLIALATAVLGSAYLSFFLPDYTAYNEMLSLFKNVSQGILGTIDIC